MPAVRGRISWICFLLLLWLGATFVYFGDTGKYSDDYWYAGRGIEREGMDWSNLPWQCWPYFWRPLHLMHVWVVNTVFWHHEWVGHLELALIHAAVCVLLYRLLVRLGSARGPAAAATLLFGTCPLLGEAIGWTSASCNAISSLLMLVTLDLGRRFGLAMSVQHADSVSTVAERACKFRAMMAIAIASFATACFYEPAAAGLAAIPIVVWSACLRGVGLGARLRQSVLAAIASGLACALYVGLLVGSAPAGQRGAAETVATVGSIPAVVRVLVRSIRHVFFGSRGRDVVLGSIEQGFAAASGHPIAFGVIVATAAAGLMALFNRRRNERLVRPTHAEEQGHAPNPRGQLLVLGIVLFAAPWTPFIAEHAQDFELRSLYVPLIGVAFIVAAIGNGLCRWMDALSHRGRGVCGVMAMMAVGMLAIAGEVGLVGMQTQFRTNAQQDAIVAAQLAAMSSHVEPETVFMILAAGHRGASTSRPVYNGALHTALEAHWCATTFVRRSMCRQDIHVISGEFWARSSLPIDHLKPKSLHETGDGPENQAVAWAKVVPLWIDSRATIHIVETLTLKPRDGPALEIALPRAQRLASAVPSLLGNNPDVTARVPRSVYLIETAHRRTRVVVESGGARSAAGATP